VAGSETFEETSRRMRLLAVAHQVVHHDLQESWQERRLADDLPTLVAERVRELPEEIVQKIEEVQDKERTGLFDTHPSDRARIRRARKRAEPGVFTLEAPATALFSNYPQRACLASMFHYAELVGGQVRPEHLVSTAALIQERRQKDEEDKRLVEYLGRVFSPYRPLEFPEVPLEPPADPQASVKALRQAYQGMFRLAPAALRASREFHEAYQKVINARRARVILEAGFKIDAKTFGLGKPTAEAAAHAESEASHAIAEVKSTLDAYAETARTRLLSALQLLLLPQAQERLKDQVPVPAELQKLHDSLIRLTWGISFVKDLQREMLTLAILLANLPGNQENAELFKKIQRGISACHQQLKTIHASYQSEPYPFEHSQGRITVSQYLLGQGPVPDQGPAVLPKCEQALDNFFTLYFRVIGRLAYHASILERVMGFPEKPIPEPEEDDTERPETVGAAG
jgi:hypothetical protein